MKKNVLWSILLLFMATVAIAQPSFPPNSPTRNSADVISLYSDTYTNVSGTDWFPNWGQSTVVSDITFFGVNSVKKYENLNYQGVQLAAPVNASAMTHLHLDIWTADASAINVFLINTSPTTVQKEVTINPTFGSWNSIDIPLSSYSSVVALNNIGQLMFTGSGTFYMDNAYFWQPANAPTIGTFTVPSKILGDAPFTLTAPTSNSTGSWSYSSSNTSVATISGSTVTVVGIGTSIITATQAAAGAYGEGTATATFVVSAPALTTAAPTPPVRNAANVISLFSNAYTNVTVDTWSAFWDNANVEDVSIGGNATKKYSNLFYAGVEFTSSTINATNMEKFHMDVYTPDATVFKVKLVDFGADGSYGGGDDVEHELGYTPTQNQWVSYDINLSDFTGLVTRGHLAQMIFVGSDNSTVYLDNIYFWRALQAPTLGTFTVPSKTISSAPFTLTAPTSNSSGTWSFTSSNPNVATISGSTVTIVGAGTSVITATQAAAGAYGSGATTANLVVTGPASPQTAAPTPPVRVASDVISLYSDAYSNVGGTNWFPWWWQNAVCEDTVIAGNATHKYPNLNYHGVEFAGVVNASTMTKLHFDIWTPNCQTFDFYLINTNTGTERKVSVNPPFAGWNSYDINLSEFSAQGIDLANIGQFKFVSDPFGGTTVYMDNIYFWRPAGAPSYGAFSIPTKTVGDAKFKITPPTSNSPVAFTYSSSNTAVATISNDSIVIVGAGTSIITASQAAGSGFLAGSVTANFTVNFLPPTTAAPIPPVRNASDVVSLFSDAYANVPVGTWSAPWDMANVADIQIGGNNTKKYNNLVFAGIEFTSPTVNASAMDSFHIDIWTPDATTFKIKLVDFGSDGSYGGGDDTEHELTYTPTLSGWVRYNIPMSAFSGLTSRANLAQMILVASNSTVYVDNVYFFRGSALSPSVSVTQPTCAVATGTINVVSPVLPGMTFSKDSINYQASTTFSGLAAGTYKIRSKTAEGIVSSPVFATVISTTPTAPSAISGIKNISKCDTLQTYSVSPVDGLTYTWSVTGTGNSVKSGQGTNTVVMVMKVAGTISVVAKRCTTNGPASTLAVTKATPTAPAAIYSGSVGTAAPLTNICLFTQSAYAQTGKKDTFRIKTVAGSYGYIWKVPGGANMQLLNDTTIAVVFADTTSAGALVSVYSKSNCDTSLAKSVALVRTVTTAPTITIQAIQTNVCGAKRYRYIAPALPAGALGYNWSFTGTLGLNAVVDSGSLTSRIFTAVFSNNAAAAAGDSVRLYYSSGCGNSATAKLKLTNTLLGAPIAPASVTATSLGANVCGQPRFRYTAPATLPVATATAVAATGYLWSFVGTLGAAATIDSGSSTSRVIVVRFSSTAASAAGDSVRVAYTSSCGTSPNKSLKLTNTLTSTNPPLAPASITIALVSDVCGVRTYRYTAPVLPAGTTTASAPNGYLWTMPFGTVGSTGVLDSGTLSSRVIKVTYSSNAAAGTGDSIKLRYTSICGNSNFKAQKLSNIAKACRMISTSKTSASVVASAQVYPNPNNGNFDINIETGELTNAPAVVRIVDMFGRTVSQFNVTTNNGRIAKRVSLNNLQNGVYNLIYTVGNKTNTMKMMIKH